MTGEPGAARARGASQGLEGAKSQSAPAKLSRWNRPSAARLVVRVLLAAAVAAIVFVVLAQYRHARNAQSVRELFSARRYDRAREPLARWLAARPSSGEARYYEAWLAVADDRPDDAASAIGQATQLSFDSKLLRCLAAILQSRSGRYNDAEPILRQAFAESFEPRALVAQELARIYLKTFRLEQAAPVIEQWKRLAPENALPYLWSNEIASRSGEDAATLIRNYRESLARDPNLANAQLGLAEQLTRDRRYDEAEAEYHAYLKRHPGDVSALVGLGRNALRSGDQEQAAKRFEAALAVDPRHPDALKELAQIDMRLRRFSQACRRLEVLTQIDPYDPEIRYSYAQALRLSGDDVRSRPEFELAARLRQEQDQIVQLRHKLLKTPGDLAARFALARWMLEHGHEKEGLAWTKEILRTHPNHGPTHWLLVDYYQKKSQPGLANYHRTLASISQDASSQSARAGSH
jgi:tetratricopeptide (TPR) repeat protein